MTDTRESVSRLIADLQGNEAMWQRLNGVALEHVVAELATQNRALLGLYRSGGKSGPDFLLRMTDDVGYLQTIALEVKHLAQPVPAGMIERFGKLTEQMDVDRSIFVTSSYFTEQARRIAEQYQKVSLIDHNGLRSWIEQYTRGRDAFLSDLIGSVQKLDVREVIALPDPTADQVEGIDPNEVGLHEEQKRSLISVDAVPLRLIAKIIRSPHELRSLTPRQFEEFVAETLAAIGFQNIVLTPRSRDGGKDIIASQKINGIPLSFYFECKHYADDNKVGLSVVRSLLGVVAHDDRKVNKGILVTTSTFTRGARKLILGDARLDGKDYDDLLGWIDEAKKRIAP